jgi:hypothetical protein
MKKTIPSVQQSFRVHFIRVHGTEKRRTVRVLLVEIPGARVVYEGYGSWSKCTRWIKQIPSICVPKSEWEIVRKLLDRKQLATIQEVSASLHDLDSLGLSRVDSAIDDRIRGKST